jgi:hypothetical protein
VCCLLQTTPTEREREKHWDVDVDVDVDVRVQNTTNAMPSSVMELGCARCDVRVAVSDEAKLIYSDNHRSGVLRCTAKLVID